MKLRFKLDVEKLTLNQIIAMQDGDIRTMRDVLANALVNGTGDYVEFEEAQEIIGNLNLLQIKEASDEFARQVKDTTVNPMIGEP